MRYWENKMSQEQVIRDWQASQEKFKAQAAQMQASALTEYYDTHLECWFKRVGTSWVRDNG